MVGELVMGQIVGGSKPMGQSLMSQRFSDCLF